MKKITSIAVILLIIVAGLSYAGEMSDLQQQNLIEKMQYLRGEIPIPLSLEEQPLHHCGTPIAFDFFKNSINLTGKYATTAASLAVRRSNICYRSIVSAGDRFRVHYTDTSFHQVYMVNIDDFGPNGTVGADGIPDYVNKIADIADSVWIFEIDSLGFMEPLKDGTNGGDSLMDIYILDLGPSYYGVTYADTMDIPYTNQSVAAFLELDNDYDIFPYNSGSDGDTMERRLDAARVTMAHEFFHTIHYATDHSEFEEQGGMAVVPWWEMTATWMEEMAYDDINDYYAYLSWYYDTPWQSLRLVFGNGFHQYAACIFPLFLSEKYDYTVVRDAWQRCRDYGVGPQYMRAINDAILAYTSDADSLLTAFNEFAVWNLFTGSRASEAPVGYRYSEAENFEMIPEAAFFVIREFCDTLIWAPGGWPTDTLCDGTSLVLFKTNMPQSASAHYIDMQNISFITDSIFSHYFIGHPDISWNVSFVGFPAGGPSPASIITTTTLSGGSFYKFEADPQLYSRIVAIPTPVETNMGYYAQKYGYSLLFGDSTFDKALPVEFYFGPNPVMANSPDAHITFFAEEITTANKKVTLEATIFNTAGEKIIKIIPIYEHEDLEAPAPGYGYYDHTNRISLEWNLCNQSGTRVAPGVYLALLELKYADGTPSVTGKAKIAVIR